MILWGLTGAVQTLLSFVLFSTFLYSKFNLILVQILMVVDFFFCRCLSCCQQQLVVDQHLFTPTAFIHKRPYVCLFQIFKSQFPSYLHVYILMHFYGSKVHKEIEILEIFIRVQNIVKRKNSHSFFIEFLFLISFFLA